jgi:hypothetical protein
LEDALWAAEEAAEEAAPEAEAEVELPAPAGSATHGFLVHTQYALPSSKLSQS